MEIPLLNKEDVEKEDIDIGEEEKDIREQIIEFLKSKDYKHLPGSRTFEEVSDLFVNDEQLIQVVISDEVPDEILEQMKEMDNKSEYPIPGVTKGVV